MNKIVCENCGGSHHVYYSTKFDRCYCVCCDRWLGIVIPAFPSLDPETWEHMKSTLDGPK